MICTRCDNPVPLDSLSEAVELCDDCQAENLKQVFSALEKEDAPRQEDVPNKD